MKLHTDGSSTESVRSLPFSMTNKPLKFFTLNTFLVPEYFRLPGQLRSAPELRAKRIAELVKTSLKPNVCALQEVWGPGYAHLAGILSGDDSTRNSYFRFFDNYYILRQYLSKSGGLLIDADPSLAVIKTWRHTFTVSATRSNKGVFAVLFNMENFWPGKKMLVCNTHLDAFNEDNKRLQMQEIKSFLQSVTIDAELEGNTAILIAGDFNCPDKSPLYDQSLMQISGEPGGVTDLLLQYAPHLAQEATFDSPSNNKLATLDCGPCRIDYLLNVCRLGGLETRFLELEATNCNLVKQEYGQELSDHWGLCCSLRPAVNL